MSFTTPIALSGLNGTNGFRLQGAALSDMAGWAVASAGDLNADGFADLIIGAIQSPPVIPGGPPPQIGTGGGYVLFGSAAGFASNIDLATLSGSTGFRLSGAAIGDRAGRAVSSAGDVNGDGFDDVIIGAFRAGNAGAASGSSYLIFGKAGGWAANMNLSALDGSNGIRLDGPAASFASGYSVSDAGDLNGDGFADVIIGAPFANFAGNQSGSSFVLFGKAGGWDASMNLSALDGSNGFRLDGAGVTHYTGEAVASAGDVNGDGIADVIIGTSLASFNGLRSGSAYVVFGKTSAWSASASLSTLDGSNGFRLDGAAALDSVGYSVSAAGDVNGDGFGDVIIGGKDVAIGGASRVGAAYVVFGKASGWSASISLSTLDGSNGFRLTGLNGGDEAGGSVGAAGDLNGDGFADLIVGAIGADPGGNPVGAGYVVFGKASGWAASLSLSALTAADGIELRGVTNFESAGMGVAGAGDVDGDGFADVIIGAPDAVSGGVGTGAAYVYLSPDTGGATYRGTTLADRLRGTASADTLNGHAGDDTLDGGAGNDSIDGGAGSDTVSYVSATAGVRVSLAIGSAQNTSGAGTDTLTNMENLRGSAFNDSLTGTGAANIMEGGAGNDTLDGAGGSDTASFAHAAAAVTYGLLSQGSGFNTGGAGTDSLSNFENLLGSGFNDVLGGDLGANTLWGGAGDDRLYAWGGNDALFGGDGHDTLYGSASGTDTLAGEAGANIYQINAVGTVVIATGADNAFVTVNGWTAAAGLIASYLSGTASQLSGGAGDDALVANNAVASSLSGGGGNDTLYGGISGADTLAGGVGVNLYQVNAVGTQITATGTDYAYLTLNGWTASGGLDAVFLSGSATQVQGSSSADVLVANSTAGSIVSGGNGNDTLWGHGLADTLNGEGGHDVLRGGVGNDVLAGGAGNDQLVGGQGADRFDFTSAGDGYDQLFDFSRSEGDMIRIAYAGGPGSFSALTVYEIGGSTVVQFGTTRIDVIGVTGMAAGDFLFA